MSAPSAHNDNIAADGDATRSVPSLLAQLDEHTLTTPFQMLAFWSAIALPFLHVPLLATGLSNPSETVTFLALLGLNLVMLLIGHSHKRE
ncbi:MULTISPECIES: hypothetical protein [Halostella]|uniref:hypothetical protein n=1 Tax=Halostella TaxID=1843185 RepID=UPI0010819520|nr:MULTISPECIES: hypothetical protein [Halostella]